MKKIYLASNSKARKKLLEKFGLKFKILPSKVKEQASRGKLSYSQLVQINARNKAKEVAARVQMELLLPPILFVCRMARYSVSRKIYWMPVGCLSSYPVNRNGFTPAWQ